MFSLLIYLYDHINRIIPGILICSTLGCNRQMNSAISISPKDFKVQNIFYINSRGILVNTYWGSEKRYHVLCLDNYSPSWIKSSKINYDKSFIKSGNLSFKTSTLDGTQIQGDVGICDSLTFENIAFRKIPFYIMPNNPGDNKSDDGVFGGDLMSKGIWKIDFKKNELTFASNIDSFKETSQAEVIPAVFDQWSVTIDVKFGGNVIIPMAIDLGYNGELLMPLKEFNKISSQKKTFATPAKFSTPGSDNVINRLSIFDTINIHHNWFLTIVSSNETIKERLIGLPFFMRFDFVIFDFINKQIYTAKKIW
jgi:hypothetical protein